MKVPTSIRRLFRDRPEPVRRWVRRILVVLAVAIVAPTVYPGRAVGQAHVDRGRTVGIQNQTERDLFFSLICMCGCPRETLGTCSCDYAGNRRDELRAMLTDGLSITAIQKAYATRFGSESLAVPPNEGFGALIWALPLVMFIAGAVLVGFLLKRWTVKGRTLAVAADAAAAKSVAADAAAIEAAGGVKPTGRDDYDQRIDDELKELDR